MYLRVVKLELLEAVFWRAANGYDGRVCRKEEFGKVGGGRGGVLVVVMGDLVMKKEVGGDGDFELVFGGEGEEEDICC